MVKTFITTNDTVTLKMKLLSSLNLILVPVNHFVDFYFFTCIITKDRYMN
jgi:hypothetical protein